MEITKDTFLEEIFHYPVFRIEKISPHDSILTTLDAYESTSPIFVYAKISSSNIICSQVLGENQFFIVDVNVLLSMKQGVLPKQETMIHVRHAEQSDREKVIAIAESCFQYSRFHLDPFIPDNVANHVKSRWVDNYFSGIRGDFLYVAESSGEIVGFLAVIVNKKVDFVTATIDLIGVHPSFQRQGIGRVLISNLITCIKRFDEITVGTQIANISSIQFYLKLGFTLTDSFFVFHYHRHTERLF